jgi:hypothetical protein
LAHRHVAEGDQALFAVVPAGRVQQSTDAGLGAVAGDGVLGTGIQRGGRRHAWILQMGPGHGNRLNVLFGQRLEFFSVQRRTGSRQFCNSWEQLSGNAEFL